ncbi:MAG: GIY-YIG nuclease family protein [Candidatus Moranbacteria bacterium]|nr:GIY-YIG nuclease family protein [Candidatus Moranbacteria bacterium]
MNLSILKSKIQKLPQTPGVYLFRDVEGRIIYIGKATDLRSRVSSYFRALRELSHHNGDLVPEQQSRPIEMMIAQVVDIEVQETESVLEALILESNLIKKHQPKYNVKEKDDKSFSYFVITKEEFPRVLILRKTDLEKNTKNKIQDAKKSQISNIKYQTSHIFGPYTSKKQMEIALKIIRKIFPFHSNKQKTEKGCLDFQLGRCPGPYAGAIFKADYRKNIRGIKMILEGKKNNLLGKLGKEMQSLAENNEFEKAVGLRNKIFALKHIQDVALISSEDDKLQIQNHTWPAGGQESRINSKLFRVEAYDISNISGQQAVGSMIVFENGEPNKDEYRKFRIKTVEGANDVAMMAEVLLRRFKNAWRQPDLVLLDGGQGHLNMAQKLSHNLGLAIPLAAVAKGPTRKKIEVRTPSDPISGFSKEAEEILHNDRLLKNIMDEAHRFAVTYHRKVRKSEFI